MINFACITFHYNQIYYIMIGKKNHNKRSVVLKFINKFCFVVDYFQLIKILSVLENNLSLQK